MDDYYSAVPLTADNADRAFPLVSLRYPDLSLHDWCRTVRRLTRVPCDGGLMTLRNLHGHVFAVFPCRIGARLNGSMVLRVSDVIMGRLPGDMLPDAVVVAAARLARDLGHARLAIEFADRVLADDVADALAQAGLEDGGRLLVRASPIGGTASRQVA
jgi:hypothetical protein